MGTLGMEAGAQPPPGLYVADVLLSYGAHEILDQGGDPLPLPGLDIDIIANSAGLSGTLRVPQIGGFWTGAVGVPYAHITLNSDDPRASVDRFGLGDVYVLPVKLGWQWQHADAVASYSFYAPTGHFEPGGSTGVGRGYWTHEIAAGGAARKSRDQGWRVSALASFAANGKKRGVDITRGAIVQVQGGAGVRLLPALDVGAAWYALWQVTEDGGAELPDKLRGLHERAFGAGPEVGVAIPWIRSRASARYEWDLVAEARPRGRVLVFSFAAALWAPVTR